jgi:hypothetical protein
MAFYAYIILDGYRYKTLAKQWRPMTVRPATPRITLLGDLEGTFGVAALMRWEGLISVPHGDSAPGAADGTLFGNIYTLRATLAKRQALTMTDHNGTVYSEAVLTGPFEEQALVNVWDSAANKYYVRVAITAKA